MRLSLIATKFLTLRIALVETLVLTTLIPGLGYLINPENPFFLNNGFPWLILVPVLISLRYGFFFGMGSASLLIILFVISRYLNWHAVPAFPVEMVVGMLAITMITAEFNEIWQQKIEPYKQKYQQLSIRMREFSRAYQILKGSHSLLEQQTANTARSIRTSLLDLQKQTQQIAKNGGEPLTGISEAILGIFSEFGSIQTASIHAVSSAHKISLHALASIGKPPSFWPTNPLIRESLKTGHVTSLQKFSDEMSQEILVVIPLIDVYQRTWGMVIVNEMPMFALQENTLDLLSLLGGHIGDLIRQRADAKVVKTDVWQEFDYQLQCTLNQVCRYNSDAAAVIFISENAQAHDLVLALLSTELRGLDKVLCFKDYLDRQIIVVLLPFTNDEGLKDFLTRFSLITPVDFGIEIVNIDKPQQPHRTIDKNVTVYNWMINGVNSPKNVLSKIRGLFQGSHFKTSDQELSRADISA